jgi:hypothetical protein
MKYHRILIKLITKGRLNGSDGLFTIIRFLFIPIQKSKLTRRRAADSTDSTARRDNEVRLFFWIGIISRKNRQSSCCCRRNPAAFFDGFHDKKGRLKHHGFRRPLSLSAAQGIKLLCPLLLFGANANPIHAIVYRPHDWAHPPANLARAGFSGRQSHRGWIRHRPSMLPNGRGRRPSRRAGARRI